MNTSRRWMNLMRFSLNVAVSLQTIWIRSERTPFSNGGHSTTRNRPKLAQKGSAKPFMRKAYQSDLELLLRQLIWPQYPADGMMRSALPWAFPVDDAGTILTKWGGLQRTVRFRGIDDQFSSQQVQADFDSRINNVL